MAKKRNTEEKIVEAAKVVFVEKGMDSASMQEIADKAVEEKVIKPIQAVNLITNIFYFYFFKNSKHITFLYFLL